MKLEEIGFYTLSNQRAKTASATSPLQRCELIVTDRCNLRCPYCRGMKKGFTGDLSCDEARETVNLWANEGLVNVRFSGGEPTLWPHLEQLVKYSHNRKVKHIALSTNGTANLKKYHHLIKLGVNDFSVSLDAGCCSVGTTMTGGICGAWEKASTTIKELSKLTYVTVGIVFNEINVSQAMETILYADSLKPSDIRIIPSAQFDKAICTLSNLPAEKIEKYPILKYRINRMLRGAHVRSINANDANRCPLVLDDVAVAKGYHFPCIIYMREHGEPIGKVSKHMRQERLAWCQSHDTHKDPICSKNCLDVCVAYNNMWRDQHERL